MFTKVLCDKCKRPFTLGKAKHKWVAPGVAMKFQQCPLCKAVFPERMQTDELLVLIRSLKFQWDSIHRLGAKDPQKTGELVIKAERLQNQIYQVNEHLIRDYGKDYAFVLRQCPRCATPGHQLEIIEEVVKIGDSEDKRVKLQCRCDWTGTWAELRKVATK